MSVGYAGANGLDHADRVGAEAIGQRQRVTPGAEVDVDEIDRDAGVADARLAGPGVTDLDILQREHFGSADAVESNGLGHDASLRQYGMARLECARVNQQVAAR